MSTGPFVTGLAAALVVGASVLSAASDDKATKGRHGSHEVAASTVYSSTFSHGAMCASGTTRASRQTLSNPFGSFNGAGSYAASFFRAGFNAGFSAGHSSARGSSLVSMPSNNGRSSRGSGVVTLPGPARQGGIATAVAHGATPALGAPAQLAGADVSPSATPEPATLLLLTSGIGGFFVARRRRSRKAN